MNSSMAVTRQPDGALNYQRGEGQASSMAQDMRLQRMLAIWSRWCREPEKVLVNRMRRGVTAGAASIDPMVKRQVIVRSSRWCRGWSRSISATTISTWWTTQGGSEIDDARHWLLTTDEKFDAITSDPFDPWVKGAATLYTKEFFQVIRTT